MSLIRSIPFNSFKKSNTKHTILLLGLIFFLTLQGFGQALTITSPTSETIWSGGTTHVITWPGGSSENVKIVFMLVVLTLSYFSKGHIEKAGNLIFYDFDFKIKLTL